MSLKCALVLILTVFNLACGIQEVKKSLVILTSSMSHEFDLLRSETILLLDNLYKLQSSEFENYILIKFGDELNKRSFSNVTVNTDYGIIKNELNVMHIDLQSRDTSCTALSYQGLYKGLELANNNSLFLVFTDAGPKHTDLLPEIIKWTIQKRITYFFTLTNGCTRKNAADSYRHIISAHNGDVFNVDDTKIKQHFKLLAHILAGPPIVPSVEILVDSTMTEFILTVTGLNGTITIFDPNQMYVSSTRYKMMTDYPTIKMIKVPDPIPGRYTVKIVSETTYSGQVQTKSDLQFKYGFSLYEPNSLDETNYAPVESHSSYLAVLPSNASLIKNLEYVRLITTNNQEYKYELIKKSLPHDDLYLALIPPHIKHFKIHVHGRDRLNYRIIRLISPNIDAILINSPEVDVETHVSVEEGESIHLTCRVISMVNVTINWSKAEINSVSLNFFDAKQSATLNYTIDKSQESDSGEYWCTAENSAGSTVSKSLILIKPGVRLNVTTPIKAINTEVGVKRLELQCLVTPHILSHVNVSWLFNGNPELPGDFQYSLPNLVLFNIQQSSNGTYTCVGQKNTEKMTDTVQLNVMYPPKILNLFNLNTNLIIDTAQPLEIDTNEFSVLQIIYAYDGNPTPSIQWMNQNGDIVSYTVELNVDFHKDTPSCEYTCHVKNLLGHNQMTVKISIKSGRMEHEFSTTTISPRISETEMIFKTLQSPLENQTSIPEEVSIRPSVEQTTHSPIFKPILIKNYTKFEKLIEGRSIILDCPFESGDYNVTWILNEKNIDHWKLSNGSIYIELVHGNMDGNLHCVASNNAGTVNATISLAILKHPYDIQVKLPADNNFYLNRSYNMECSANGDPKPNLYWIKNQKYFKPEPSILFEKVQQSDSGEYICVAKNFIGKIYKSIILNASTHHDESMNTSIDGPSLRAPYNIRVEKSTDKILILNDRYKLTCTATGHPQPEFFWIKDDGYFKKGSFIVFDQIKYSDNGRYLCVAFNDLGRISKSLILKISSSPQFVNLAGFLKATNRNNANAFGTLNTLNFIPVGREYFESDYEKIVEVNENGKIILNCTMSGEPPPQIKWFKNNVDLNKIHRPILAYQNADVSNSGIYKCIGSNVIGQAKAVFYVNVKKPVYIENFVSSKPIYNQGDISIITCAASGNPLPTIRINSENYSTSTSLIFGQPTKNETRLFESQKIIYFDGNTMIDAKRAASLDRYSKLYYTKNIVVFKYIMNSVRPSDAGIYKCTAISSSKLVHKQIKINIKSVYSEPIVHQTYNIIQNTDMFKLECPLPRRLSNINWWYGNKKIKSNHHLTSSGRILLIREPQPNHTGLYKCTAENMEATIKIVVEPLLLHQFSKKQVNIEKGMWTLLKCSLGENSYNYWFEMLNYKNFSTNTKIYPINQSQNYELLADQSRTILCLDKGNPGRGQIFEIIVPAQRND